MTDTASTKAKTISEINDAFRQSFAGGMVVMTAGVKGLPPDRRRSVVKMVRDFDDFTGDNDPHGEHDFGAVDEDDISCFWKIDYYDLGMTNGSPDPANPSVTTRVLTIMLTDEY
jgi:Protein of unknown function (DUF3768)